MDAQIHNQIVSFIWGIADDCLRDVYVRGKYRDVILPLTVIRRFNEGNNEEAGEYFYKPAQPRELAEIAADIRGLERETEGLLEEVLA